MALAPAKLKKTWPGSLGKHATFVAILSAPAADTNRWHSRATRSSAMDGGSWMLSRGDGLCRAFAVLATQLCIV